MVQTPPQTDTYNTALDIFDRTHPLRVDVDENLKVVIEGGAVTPLVIFATRADTYTTPASGATVNVSTTPLKVFSISVKGTDAPATAWDVFLEGSLDGITWTPTIEHTEGSGDGIIVYSGALFFPALYFRSRCSTITLGPATNIVVTILGVV